MDKKKIIIIIGIVITSIVLILLVIKLFGNNSGSNEFIDKGYTQCFKDVSDKEMESSNWKHNDLNYYVDKDNNRVNDSDFIKKEYKLENGIVLSNMSIISENCSETKANISFSFTNNSGSDIKNGLLDFYFKSSNDSDEIHISVNVGDVKKNETKTISGNYKFRIIDALNYKVTFTNNVQFVG